MQKLEQLIKGDCFDEFEEILVREVEEAAAEMGFDERERELMFRRFFKKGVAN